MKVVYGLAFAALLAAMDFQDARAEWHVWTVSETRHVLRDEPPGSEKAVHFAAARNEWESFQILIRSDAPVKGINVAPGDLTGPDGAILPRPMRGCTASTSSI